MGEEDRGEKVAGSEADQSRKDGGESEEDEAVD